MRAGLHVMGQVCGCLLAAPVLLGLLPRPPRPPLLGPRLSPAQVNKPISFTARGNIRNTVLHLYTHKQLVREGAGEELDLVNGLTDIKKTNDCYKNNHILCFEH